MTQDFNKDLNSQDVLEANEILLEIHKLIDREKGENQPNVISDVGHLEDAAESLQKFIEAEGNEAPSTSDEEPEDNTDIVQVPTGVVDTSTLTGPLNSLKSFLVKKQQDIQNQ